MKRFPIVLLLLVTAAQLIHAQAQDLPAELLTYVQRFTVAARVDCGIHKLRGRAPNLAMATEGELRDSVGCAVKAAGEKKAFWMLYQLPATDSWLGVGLLGTPDGEIYRFSFDSQPCGSSDCSGRLSLDRCDTPSIGRRMDIGPPEIRCTTER